MNDYDYDYQEEDDEEPLFLQREPEPSSLQNVNFDDPEIKKLPRVLLMGPRRSGKTSVQVSEAHNKSTSC